MVSTRNPYWVDFTGNLFGAATWGDDGSTVSGTVTVEGNDVTQCGVLDIETGQASLQDCSQTRPFLCLKIHGKYVSLADSTTIQSATITLLLQV